MDKDLPHRDPLPPLPPLPPLEMPRSYASVPAQAPAATGRPKRSFLRAAATGLVVGALSWIGMMELGIHNVFHMPGYGGIIGGAVLGALVNATRWRALLWTAAACVAILLPVIWYTPVIVKPARALVRSDPVPAPPLTVDAIVVLASGLTAEGNLDPSGVERLLSGLALTKATNTNVLVTTRVRLVDDPEVSTDRDQRRLVSLSGMPLRHYIINDVGSTRDEAMGTAQLARSERWGRVAVVTSPLHSRRACGAFERAGLRVTCAPAEPRAFSVAKLSSPGDRIEAFRLWLYEMAGTTQYRLLGWLP